MSKAKAEKRTAQVVGAAETTRAGGAAFLGRTGRTPATPPATLPAGLPTRLLTDTDNDPDPDGSDPEGSSDSSSDSSSDRWPMTTGDDGDDPDLSDPLATKPQISAVKVGKGRDGGNRDSVAALGSPSASMVARKKVAKQGKQRERYARMTPLQRLRQFREVDYNDLQALLDIGSTTASRMLRDFPQSRDTNRFGDRVRVADVDPLMRWLRGRPDPQYQVYAAQLERLLKPSRSPGSGNPKARARAMVDWDEESLDPQDSQDDGAIPLRHLAVVGGPNGSLNRAELNPMSGASSEAV